jgi:hypothetical protein
LLSGGVFNDFFLFFLFLVFLKIFFSFGQSPFFFYEIFFFQKCINEISFAFLEEEEIIEVKKVSEKIIFGRT